MYPIGPLAIDAENRRLIGTLNLNNTKALLSRYVLAASRIGRARRPALSAAPGT
jgi:hypothetical protein